MNLKIIFLYMKYYDIEKEYCIKWLHCIKKVIKNHEPLYNFEGQQFLKCIIEHPNFLFEWIDDFPPKLIGLIYQNHIIL